ncbi:MAG: hypothetical protein WC069_06300 [Candidatus Shapirobacteria bacterium]
MSIFTITFRRNIQPENKKEILDNLVSNLSETDYDNIKRIENDKLTIEAEFISFEPSKYLKFNIWRGFSKRTVVSISGNEISYKIDYTYAVIKYLLPLVFLFLFIPVLGNLDFNQVKQFYPFLMFPVASIISIAVKILFHRNIFISTLKHGSNYKGTYDWNRILKSKTVAELENIVQGKTTLTNEVRELAKKELSHR